jgi:SAM-dependent methyltransferase
MPRSDESDRTPGDAGDSGCGEYPAQVPYVFDNAGEQAAARFAALPELFDPGTIRHLEQIGVGPGWNCLEVGAGAGSIADWLARRVGPAGHVLATDLDTRFLKDLDRQNRQNLEVRRHDVASDPLPEAAFDLVHTRLVLLHLPGREKALARLVAALRPGGWLLAEEFDSLSMPPDPSVNPDETLLKTLVAMGSLMAERGVHRGYGRLLTGSLRRHGLADVGAEGRLFMWQGGSAGARLLRANFEQLRDALIASGRVSADAFAADVSRLEEPDFWMPSSVMWAAWGRREDRGPR